MSFHFADISDYEAGVDLRTYAKSSPVIAMKATEGINYTSPKFAGRWKEARKRGLVRVAYHFGHVGSDRPKGEADRFFNVVAGAGLYRGDVLVLDAESGALSPRDSRLWMGTFLAHLDARSHHYANVRPAWIYGGAWLREHLSPGAINRYLWLAAYVNNPDPYVPNQFSNRLFIAWQFTDGQSGPGPHSLPGVGVTDINTFRGNTKRLHAVAGTPIPRRIINAIKRKV